MSDLERGEQLTLFDFSAAITEEAYNADEAFFTGTAAEVTPISNIDSRIIGNGKRGPVSKALQDAYFDIVMGKNPKYENLLTYIN